MATEKLQKGDLVLVMGDKDDIPKRPCLGIIVFEYPNTGWFMVSVGKIRSEKVSFSPTEIVVKPDLLHFISHTEKFFTEPHKAVIKNFDTVMLNILVKLFPGHIVPGIFAEIGINVLVIVRESVDRKPCWGLVNRLMLHEKLNVITGSFWLVSRKKLILSPGDVIPIVQTDGKTGNVQKVVARNLDKILICILLSLMQKGTKPNARE